MESHWRRRRVLVKVVSVVAAVVGIMSFSLSANAAPPNGSAVISRSIYLASESPGFAVLPSGGVRAIELAAGEYNWGLELWNGLGWQGYTRKIYLASGLYWWGCTMEGTGKYFPQQNYGVYCELDGATEDNYNDHATVPVNKNNDLLAVDPGTYTWDGYLQGA
jgi:hypothetical protein